MQKNSRQSGQAMVIFALAAVLLFGFVGLAIDSGIGYLRATAAERAAAAGALAGVTLMPGDNPGEREITKGNVYDAVKTAVKDNGFSTSADTLSVTRVTRTTDGTFYNDRVTVTVSETDHTTFLNVLGIGTVKIVKAETARWTPPITLGQSGPQLGATECCTGAGSYPAGYVLRQNSWNTPLGNGDPFSTCAESAGAPDSGRCPPPPPPHAGACPTCQNVHLISKSNGTELSGLDKTYFPDHGGYNYLISTSEGAGLNIYNPALDPNGISVDAPSRSGYYGDELWGLPRDDKESYAATQYSIFEVPNPYDRSKDKLVEQVVFGGFDATGCTTYALLASCEPKDVQVPDKAKQVMNSPQMYHNWVDLTELNNTKLTDLTGGVDHQSLINIRKNDIKGKLSAGIYRLRVDALDFEGKVPTEKTKAASGHGYAVAAFTPGTTTGCSTCLVQALDDMAIQTESGDTGTTAPVFSIPAAYAGQEVNALIYDPGDLHNYVAGKTANTLSLCEPAASTPTCVDADLFPRADKPGDEMIPQIVGPDWHDTWPAPSDGYNFPSECAPSFSKYRKVHTQTSDGSGNCTNGKWILLRMTLSSSYNPGANGYWKLRETPTGATEQDDLTIMLPSYPQPPHICPNAGCTE